MSQKTKDKKEDILRVGIAGASYETVQRYGSAVKEHLVAYSGKDNETGIQLKKSLKSIQAQATNDEFSFQIRQQKTGWAAEVKETANVNAERIIKRNTTKKIRYDDLPGQSANDQLYDHVEIDLNGNVIEGTKTQMKFVGASEDDPLGVGNAERTLKKLQSKEYRKYHDNDVKITVPKDEYQQIIDKTTEKIDSLQRQLERARKSGNAEAVEKIESEIETLNKIKKNLRPSTVTRKESQEAVDTPKISTAKSIAKVSHRAGLKTAQTAAIIGGSTSLVRNIVGVCQGKVEADEAAKNVIKDTAQTAVVGYGTGFAGSAIKGTMQNSASEYTRALAKTNIAGTIVAVTVSASKTLKRYFSGEIDGTECMECLGEQGTGMIASSMFAVVGQAAIPIPIVGGMIGGMVGYALSSATYGILMSSLKEAKLAHEERIAIEKACAEHIEMIREYRKQMNELIEEYLSEKMEVFNESFSGIKSAFAIGDVDLFIDSANSITESLGGNKPFETMEEFDNKMICGTTFKL